MISTNKNKIKSGNKIKKSNTTAPDVLKFLKSTGFLFELEMAKILKNKGYNIYPTEYFLDLESGKKREIDIIAVKVVNDIRILLVIECKQSLEDSWVFICSKNKPKRYYSSVKYLPNTTLILGEDIKFFKYLHVLDNKKILAQNYIVFNKSKGKKSDGDQIDSAINKLPKALIYAGTRVGKEKRALLFPVVLFSGKIFSVRHDGRIADVKEQGLVQYEQIFNSNDYEKNINKVVPESHPLPRRIIFPEIRTEDENISIARRFNGQFLIDFICKKSFIKYLTMIEKRVNKIPTSKWSLKIK